MNRNANGVEIVYIALSIEPTGFDSSVQSFASNIGFDHAALDLVEEGGQRVAVRNGFSYYTGELASRTPGQVSTSNRRRFVILDGQAGPDAWRLAYISNDFFSSQASTVRAAIDGIALAGGGNPDPEPDPDPEPEMVQVTVGVSPDGAGSVSGAGSYASGATVGLQAEAAPGYRFIGWQGSGLPFGDASEISFVVESNFDLTAMFAREWNLALVAPSGGGSVQGGGWYLDGETVTISALAADGFRFAGWSGAAVSDPTQASTQITLSADTAVNASFVALASLSVTAGEGGTASGSGLYDEGAQATIVAQAASGYRFRGWLGEGVAEPMLPTTTITVGSDSVVEAQFARVWLVSLTAGEGGAVEGGGVFDQGSNVSVTAVPEDGYRFTQWLGDGVADPMAAVTTVSVGGETSLEAQFVRVWPVNLTAAEGGAVEGAGVFDQGSEVTVTASPAEGYRFVGWLGEGPADPLAAVTTLTVGGETSLEAQFVRVWSVTVTAAEGGAVEGAGVFDQGSEVTVTAVPQEGYRFVRWVGADVDDPTSEVTTLSVSGEASLEAQFIRVWQLSVMASGGGTAEGSGSYDDGTEVRIVAQPDEGFRFVRWEGNVAAPEEASTSVVLQGNDVVVSALFQNLTTITPVDPDPVADADGDELPDEWERQFGLRGDDPSDAEGDLDKDGSSNRDEFYAGTDPTDPASRLFIRELLLRDGLFTLRWSGIPGTHYRVDSADDLQEKTPWHEAVSLEASGELVEVSLAQDTVGSFFRLVAMPEATGQTEMPAALPLDQP